MSTYLDSGNDSWIPFSINQPSYRGLEALIISYWGRREIKYAASEKSCYHTHSVVTAAFQQFAKEDEACLAEGFSERLVQIFRDQDLSLWRIPVLNLEGLTCDNIHGLQAKNMPKGASIARFKDRDGRPGLAIHIQGKVDGWAVASSGYQPMRHVQDIMVIFKSSSAKDANWQIGGGGFIKQIIGLYFSLGMQVEDLGYAFKDTRARFNFVERIISDTDLCVRTVSEIPQMMQAINA